MLNKSVILTGLSKKGKERVQRDGSTGWTISQVADRVAFSSEGGLWLRIENGNDRAMRWVHSTHDKNFHVEVEK
ncbi:MAG TPA: hypothetical protein VMW10_08705 [Alphaproteobacteria bacterium]|nr:hypothetical protein [Alphaproteobacteria bacterium]